MAQKKKKGKPPQQKKQVRRKKISFAQVIFSLIAIFMILSLIIPLVLR
jgi:hypothetical protein